MNFFTFWQKMVIFCFCPKFLWKFIILFEILLSKSYSQMKLFKLSFDCWKCFNVFKAWNSKQKFSIVEISFDTSKSQNFEYKQRTKFINFTCILLSNAVGSILTHQPHTLTIYMYHMLFVLYLHLGEVNSRNTYTFVCAEFQAPGAMAVSVT